MKACLIISGGEYSPIPDNLTYEYIIACDRGVEYALRSSIIPNLIMGDFDSYTIDYKKSPQLIDIPVIQSPIRKDYTDTFLAVKHALQMGFKHIIISCGLGLRVDHMLANIQVMHFVAQNHGICEMISSNDKIRTLTPEDGIINIPKKPEFDHLSLLAITDNVNGLHIQGTDYDTTIDITSSFPIGHGNKILSDYARIEIKSGVLLIIESKDR